MALRFGPTEGDLSLQSEYAELAPDLFQSFAPMGSVLSGLSKYGLRLSDLRLETAGTLGDLSLLGYLFNFAVTIRVRLDRMELQCSDLKRVGATRWDQLVVDVFKSMKSVKPNLTFKTHVLALNVHGSLEGVTTLGFLSRYATAAPEGLGPKTGTGVVHYFGPEGARLASSLTLDLSLRVPDGLFLRVHSTWDGQTLEATELPPAADAYVRRVFKSLELEPLTSG